MFALERQANTSLFHWGFAIPGNYVDSFQGNLSEGPVEPGKSRKIKLVIYGQCFPVKITNINARARGNREILQVRYDNDQTILSFLRLVFHVSWDYLNAQRNMSNHIKKTHISLPDEFKEYLVVKPFGLDAFSIDCFPCDTSQKMLLTQQFMEQGESTFSDKELNEMKDELKEVPEIQTEIYDEDTDYYHGTALQRIRKLNRNVGELLRKLYDFRCQITGEKVGDFYGAKTVEVHHIIPFTKSLNNNSSNLIVLSPNFHRIIHQVHPMFDREKLQFVFQNGVIEKVKLNSHLCYSILK